LTFIQKYGHYTKKAINAAKKANIEIQQFT